MLSGRDQLGVQRLEMSALREERDQLGVQGLEMSALREEGMGVRAAMRLCEAQRS